MGLDASTGQTELKGRRMAGVFDKLRIPAGSLAVDVSLVVYIAFMGGQTLNRFEAMDSRIAHVEQTLQAERLSERTSLLEQRAGQAERDRAEILDALHRIEAKLDSKADKVR